MIPERGHHLLHGVAKHRPHRQVQGPDGRIQEPPDELQRLSVGSHGDRQGVHFGPLRPGQIIKVSIGLKTPEEADYNRGPGLGGFRSSHMRRVSIRTTLGWNTQVIPFYFSISADFLDSPSWSHCSEARVEVQSPPHHPLKQAPTNTHYPQYLQRLISCPPPPRQANTPAEDSPPMGSYFLQPVLRR